MIKKQIRKKICIVTKNNKIGFFTGNSFDSSIKLAKIYANNSIANIIAKKYVDDINIKCIYLIPSNILSKNVVNYIKNEKKVKKIRVQLKKNPVKDINREISTASILFENFTGHCSDNSVIVNIPEYNVGVKIGECLGIMYKTMRDGISESYLHEFKKESQPIFAVSHDGKQLFLIDGNYKFTETGINDE